MYVAAKLTHARTLRPCIHQVSHSNSMHMAQYILQSARTLALHSLLPMSDCQTWLIRVPQASAIDRLTATGHWLFYSSPLRSVKLAPQSIAPPPPDVFRRTSRPNHSTGDVKRALHARLAARDGSSIHADDQGGVSPLILQLCSSTDDSTSVERWFQTSFIDPVPPFSRARLMPNPTLLRARLRTGRERCRAHFSDAWAPCPLPCTVARSRRRQLRRAEGAAGHRM